MSDEFDIEFVGKEIPDPARHSVSEATLERLKEQPGVYARIASEEWGLSPSTVRSRGVSLRQYADRRGISDNVEIAERTENGKLNVYARWKP